MAPAAAAARTRPAAAGAALRSPVSRPALTRYPPIASAAKTGAAPLTIDGTPIYPSELGTSGLNDPTDLPTPLLAAMVLLALGTLAAATRWSLTHVRKRRTTS